MSLSAPAVRGRQIVLAPRPAGKPTPADLRLEKAAFTGMLNERTFGPLLEEMT